MKELDFLLPLIIKILIFDHVAKAIYKISHMFYWQNPRNEIKQTIAR